MQKAEKLITEIEKAKRNWNERTMFKIMGKGNLSNSDLDTLKLYAETYIIQGNTYGLMKQYGDIGEILTECGIQ